MKNTIRRRPLAFEQMEQRLALTASPVSAYLSLGDLDFNGLSLQTADISTGGNITVDVVLSWVTRNSHAFSDQASFIDIREGEVIFSGPNFAQPEPEGKLEFGEVGSKVSPIPQPQIGKGEIARGLVAVAEIFRPVTSLSTAQVTQPLVKKESPETAVASTIDDSWKSTSLFRGRDMYFEVAELTDGQESSNRNNGTELSNSVMPLIYQQALERRETDRASATTSQTPTKTPRQLPPVPTAPEQKAERGEDNQSELPANDAAAEKTGRTAQRGKLPVVDVFSEVSHARDYVFASLHDGEELSEEGIALRTETQAGHSATWPVLAALAATGWMAKTRRSAGILPSDRRPLRRK